MSTHKLFISHDGLPWTTLHYNSSWKLMVIIVISWVISLVLNTSVFFSPGGQFDQVAPFRECTIKPTVGPYYFLVWRCLSSYIPVATATLVYFVLFLQHSVWSPSRISAIAVERRDQVRVRRSTVQRRLAVTRMLCVFWLWYCICYLPLTVMPVQVVFTSANWRGQTLFRFWTRAFQLSAYAFSPVRCTSVEEQDELREMLYQNHG